MAETGIEAGPAARGAIVAKALAEMAASEPRAAMPPPPPKGGTAAATTATAAAAAGATTGAEAPGAPTAGHG
eukprot:2272702-Pleurochrysis_carterae.AAC.1